jgi:hypothetical protein
MAKEKETAEAASKTAIHKYTKAQIASARRYENDIDIINALLKDDRQYTTAEVDTIINDFKKGRVK